MAPEHVAGFIGAVAESGSHFLGLAQRDRAEQGIHVFRVLGKIERVALAIVQAFRAAMFAAAVAELDVLLLEKRRIGQHGKAQVDGGRSGVDRPGVAVMNQGGKISTVIDVGVRKNHAVDTGHRKRKITVALKRLAAASLVQTTVEKESLSCRLDVVHGPGDRLGGTPKSDSH